jgi:hypothetical protein
MSAPGLPFATEEQSVSQAKVRMIHLACRSGKGTHSWRAAAAGLSPDEKYAWDQLDDFYKNGLGYAPEMNNRPQTLYGIADSPVGLAAWMIDHDIRSYRMITRALNGKPGGLTRTDVLDNVTLYWLTNTRSRQHASTGTPGIIFRPAASSM